MLRLNWDYEDVPGWELILAASTKAVLSQLLGSSDERFRFVSDTRSTHGQMFELLTPVEHKYFAGHYRGSLGELLGYEVKVGRSQGAVSSTVESLMRTFHSDLLIQFKDFASGAKAHDSYTIAELEAVVESVCEQAIDFLRVHPYANGNGHIARLMIIVLLEVCGVPLDDFPVEPKPGREFYDCMKAYFDGSPDELIDYLMDRIALL